MICHVTTIFIELGASTADARRRSNRATRLMASAMRDYRAIAPLSPADAHARLAEKEGEREIENRRC